MSSLFDAEDDLSLRTRRGSDERSSARERSVDLDDAPADREVTLNTGTVLTLFFALALICAVFFGFGYSMGRKSTQAPATAAAATDTESAADTTTSSSTASSKPAPGSPAIQPIPGYLSQQQADAANSGPAQSVQPRQTPSTATEPAPARTTKETPAAVPAAPVVRTAPQPAAAPVTSSAPAAPGEVYVQIAAVSHQEDADVLRSALGRRGYKVLERSDANDRLIHVQIGPFTDRKAAEATRQKLLADGYNAFLK